MKTLQEEQAFKLWDKWWSEMQGEWFKLEVLQDYSGEDSGPSLEAWLAGRKEKSINLMAGEMEEWISMCQKSSVVKRRYHVIREPHTPYIEWEIESYKKVNVPLAGELVYLIPETKVKNLDVPDGDVMIFDQKKVARAHYSPEGKIEKMDFYEQPEDDISKWLQLRNSLIELGQQVVA